MTADNRDDPGDPGGREAQPQQQQQGASVRSDAQNAPSTWNRTVRSDAQNEADDSMCSDTQDVIMADADVSIEARSEEHHDATTDGADVQHMGAALTAQPAASTAPPAGSAQQQIGTAQPALSKTAQLKAWERLPDSQRRLCQRTVVFKGQNYGICNGEHPESIHNDESEAIKAHRRSIVYLLRQAQPGLVFGDAQWLQITNQARANLGLPVLLTTENSGRRQLIARRQGTRRQAQAPRGATRGLPQTPPNHGGPQPSDGSAQDANLAFLLAQLTLNGQFQQRMVDAFLHAQVTQGGHQNTYAQAATAHPVPPAPVVNPAIPPRPARPGVLAPTMPATAGRGAGRGASRGASRGARRSGGRGHHYHHYRPYHGQGRGRRGQAPPGS